MQVGCTINYARRGCGKKQKLARVDYPRVDYPGNVGENDSGTSLDPDSSDFLVFNRGPVAQLGARFHGMEEVAGSIPARSTNSLYHAKLNASAVNTPVRMRGL